MLQSDQDRTRMVKWDRKNQPPGHVAPKKDQSNENETPNAIPIITAFAWVRNRLVRSIIEVGAILEDMFEKFRPQ